MIRSCRPPSRQRCLATYICAAESFFPKSGFHRPKFAAPAGVAAGRGWRLRITTVGRGKHSEPPYQHVRTCSAGLCGGGTTQAWHQNSIIGHCWAQPARLYRLAIPRPARDTSLRAHHAMLTDPQPTSKGMWSGDTMLRHRRILRGGPHRLVLIGSRRRAWVAELARRSRRGQAPEGTSRACRVAHHVRARASPCP